MILLWRMRIKRVATNIRRKDDAFFAPEEPAPLYCGGNILIETKFG
jgi:hypothetical protein